MHMVSCAAPDIMRRHRAPVAPALRSMAAMFQGGGRHALALGVAGPQASAERELICGSDCLLDDRADLRVAGGAYVERKPGAARDDVDHSRIERHLSDGSDARAGNLDRQALKLEDELRGDDPGVAACPIGVAPAWSECPRISMSACT